MIKGFVTAWWAHARSRREARMAPNLAEMNIGAVTDWGAPRAARSRREARYEKVGGPCCAHEHMLKPM